MFWRRSIRSAFVPLLLIGWILYASGVCRADEINIMMVTLSHDGHIITEDGQEFFVLPGGAAVELGQYQGQQVIVTGFTGDGAEEKTFKVTSFQPVPKKDGGGDAEKSDD